MLSVLAWLLVTLQNLCVPQTNKSNFSVVEQLEKLRFGLNCRFKISINEVVTQAGGVQ